MALHDKKCVPCEIKIPPLTPDVVRGFVSQLTTTWEVVDTKEIRQQFKFKNFKEAMHFVNQIAEVAEAEGHHPDITINYNKVLISLTTHFIGGLSENDFILASKIERLGV